MTGMGGIGSSLYFYAEEMRAVDAFRDCRFDVVPIICLMLHTLHSAGAGSLPTEATQLFATQS